MAVISFGKKKNSKKLQFFLKREIIMLMSEKSCCVRKRNAWECTLVSLLKKYPKTLFFHTLILWENKIVVRNNIFLFDQFPTTFLDSFMEMNLVLAFEQLKGWSWEPCLGCTGSDPPRVISMFVYLSICTFYCAILAKNSIRTRDSMKSLDKFPPPYPTTKELHSRE